MPIKPGQKKNKKTFKKYAAVIPSKKDPKRPIRPALTEYSPRGIRVTGLTTAGKRKRPK